MRLLPSGLDVGSTLSNGLRSWLYRDTSSSSRVLMMTSCPASEGQGFRKLILVPAKPHVADTCGETHAERADQAHGVALQLTVQVTCKTMTSRSNMSRKGSREVQSARIDPWACSIGTYTGVVTAQGTTRLGGHSSPPVRGEHRKHTKIN
ncbi:hypothetical protein T440DRAFT_264698 [Plenodomus tracheiphilus IPT5]|uniref:Uncharacterized protein n=1 Tax=Plenodomus tracheiphilus IPT5 TaxID=1408161 RepID=A0A6A7ARU7_9PLEO|nr:hypothetical protein T440DRAFT_264698 [Plenodomus tracheiphilus IPT5]